MTTAAAVEELRVGPYRLQRRLGKGGAGQVYLAWKDNPTTKKNVLAVKMLRASYATDAEGGKQLLQEGELGLALGSHDNLVHVFDVGLYRDSMPYIVMEYVDGIDLGRLLAYCIEHDAPLSVPSIHHIVSGIASALQHAHTEATIEDEPLRIIHRDVKPENVLISRDGAVKLMDFGVGVVLSDGTTGSKLRGTYRYMSPEHIEGEVCEAMDIYSLGVLFWELLANRRYRADCEGEAHLPRIYEGDIPKLRHPDRQLVNLVMSCLSQHPGLRPTAAELLEALARCKDHSRDPTILRQEILPIIGRRRSSGASGQQAAAEPEAIATLTAVDHRAVQDAVQQTVHVPSWELVDGQRVDRDAPRSFHRQPRRADETRKLIAVRQALPVARSPKGSQDAGGKSVDDSDATTNPLGTKARKTARRNASQPHRSKPVPILTLVSEPRDLAGRDDLVQRQRPSRPRSKGGRSLALVPPPSLAFLVLAASVVGAILTLLTAYSFGLIGAGLGRSPSSSPPPYEGKR